MNAHRSLSSQELAADAAICKSRWCTHVRACHGARNAWQKQLDTVSAEDDSNTRTPQIRWEITRQRKRHAPEMSKSTSEIELWCTMIEYITDRLSRHGVVKYKITKLTPVTFVYIAWVNIAQMDEKNSPTCRRPVLPSIGLV